MSAITTYLARAPKWRTEMQALRHIIRSTGGGLTEDMKWGKPCYSLDGANLLILQPFKDHCSLLFCKGALLNDPQHLLKKPGENTQAARRLEFTSLQQVRDLETATKTLIKEAVKAEKAGLEVEYKKDPEPLPAELQNRFKEDPSFKKAFHALTPGRQRAYILHFSAAKQSATRAARIEKCVPQILEGKGWNERPSAKSSPPPLRGTEAKRTSTSNGDPEAEHSESKGRRDRARRISPSPRLRGTEAKRRSTSDGGPKGEHSESKGRGEGQGHVEQPSVKKLPPDSNKASSKKKPVTLLSGGNPQIAKADGDEPVQAYIAALSGWKKAICVKLDTLIVRHAPSVHKAVKWNSPFYGIEGNGWFLSFHVFTRYVKVTFFKGASLKPLPPGGTQRSKEARWLDIGPDTPFDEPQLRSWIKQAAKLPGWRP